jgi:hypothetical protein
LESGIQKKFIPDPEVKKAPGSRMRSTCTGAELPIRSIWDPDPTDKIELLQRKIVILKKESFT